MVWALLTRVYGKFAVSLAEYIAQNTGIELREPGAYARNLEPGWINVTYSFEETSDVQSIGQGWQWLHNALTTIQSLHAKSDYMMHCSQEIATSAVSPYPGQGLNSRLDAAIAQARALANTIPMDFDQIQSFVEDITDDVTLAVKGQEKDSNAAWAE
eukprot:8746889-Pyramimonas_sp.AAC.1